MLQNCCGVLSMEFAHWAATYEEAVGELSQQTWQAGILKEVSRLGKNKGRVLDVGAGTGIGGRLLKKLAPFHITALDRSAEMLALANGVYDQTINRGFSSFEIPGSQFEFIVSGFDSLNYLPEPQLKSFFDSVRKALAPQGYLIFDYSSPKLLWEDWLDKKYEQQLSNAILKWGHRLNPENRGSEITLTLLDKDRRKLWQEEHVQYTYDCYQMHRLTQNSGLTIERIRNLESETFSPAQKTHVYVITRSEQTE